MALLPSELARCKFELGYNALSLSALPYAIDGITQMFEQIVAPYLQAGALAFSSTVVVAASAATPVVLTLSSGTGFTVGSVVIVDQGDTQESSYVQVIAGTSLTVPLLNAHSGTYPVTVEGGESIVRDILRECRALGGPGGSISLAASSAASRSPTRATSSSSRTRATAAARSRRCLSSSATGATSLRRHSASRTFASRARALGKRS
jgi:hypothetical protein